MAPPPEYDKEPKAPDKSVANTNDDIKTVLNVVSDQQTNCDDKSTGAASNVETQDDQQVGALDEGRLRALLDEVMTYKCPKDREGKSSLFKGLLEEVEQDEEACSAASIRAWGRSAGRRRGRRALPQSNSMQDLVAALGAAEGPPRRRVSPVSSRGKQGGSLPSVDTYHQESGGYVATVHCVNPAPHPPVERRVSASDAHSPAELELLHNRRSKVAVYAPTYTARASLEIGSGSVCSGRAVTTTTASNQVRTLDSPHTRDGGGRPGPRGPTVQIDVTKYKHAPPVKKFIPTAKSTNKQNKPDPPKEKPPIYGPPDSTVFKEMNRKPKFNDRRPSNNVSKNARANDGDAYKETAGKFSQDISDMLEKDDRNGCAGASTASNRPVRNYVNNDVRYPISKSLPSMGRGFPKDDNYTSHPWPRDRPTFDSPEAISNQTRQKPTKSIPKKISGKNENVNGPSDNNNNSGLNDKYLPGNRLVQTLLPDRNKSSRKLNSNNSIPQVDNEKQLPDSVKEPGEIVRKKKHTNSGDVKAAKVSSNTDNKQNCGLGTQGNKSNKKTCQNVFAQTKSHLNTKNAQLKAQECDPTNNELVPITGKVIVKEIIPNKNIITKGEMKNTIVSDKSKLSSSPIDESSSSLSKINIPKENNVIDQDIYKRKKHQLKQKYIDVSENSNPGVTDIVKLDIQEKDVQSTKSQDKSKSDDILNIKSDINNCDIIENSEKLNTLNKLVSECDNKLRTNDSQTLLSESDVNNKQIYKQVSISSLCLSGNNICESDDDKVKKLKNNKIENSMPAKKNVKCLANSDIVSDENTTEINIEKNKEKCEIIINTGEKNVYENRDKVIIEMPDDAEEMQEIGKVAIETIENAAYEEKGEENVDKLNGEAKEVEIDIDVTADSAGEEKIVRNFDFSLLSGEQLIFTRLHNNSFIFLELPNHLCVTESNNQLLAINNSSDNSNVISVIPLTKYLQETNKDDNKDVHKTSKLKDNKSKKRSKRSTNTLNTINEVDAGVPFSCITTPEVVSSCNTTSSTSQAVAVDPKPRNVFASTFNGIRNYGSSNCAIEDKKSLDENGNSVQGYSLTGSSQLKKNRKKKSSKNETVINIDQMDGYQGNKDVNELLRFIESDALDNARGTKLGGKSKHKDDSDDKGGKKRSTERRTKDKETKLYKVKRATSMEELSTRVPSLTGSEKESRRSWDDAAPPSPPPADLERDFQTVTKRKRTRRRPVPDVVQCCRRDEPTRPDVLAADEDLSGVTFGFDLDPSLLGEPVRPGLYYRAPTPVSGGDGHLQRLVAYVSNVQCCRRDEPARADVLAADEDLSGVSFGFEVDPSLLGQPVRPGLYYSAPTPVGGGDAHLQRLVAYVSNAWDDIMRCGNGKVRFYSE